MIFLSVALRDARLVAINFPLIYVVNEKKNQDKRLVFKSVL